MAVKLEPGTVVQTPDGQEFVIGFDKAQPVWDSSFICSTESGDVFFFKTDKGGKLGGTNNDSVKANDFYTSEADGGDMPNTDAFTVLGSGIEMLPDIGYTPLMQVLKRGYAELRIGGDAASWKGTISMLPQGNGLDGSSVVNNREWVRNGPSDPRSLRRFSIPMYIGAGSTYYGKINFHAAVALGTVADAMLKWVLYGIKSTGVGATS